MTGIEKFFQRYEQGANNFDPALVVSQYAASFMLADPNGAQCMQNDAKFRKAVPEREALFRKLGFQSAKVLQVTETPLDERYTMALVHWHMVFEKDPGVPLDFKFFVTYFLYDTKGKENGDERWKVVFYISHDDEQKVMRDAGLI